MNKICPKGCFATDKDHLRCPQCGTVLQRTSMSQDEIIEETKQRHKEAWKLLQDRGGEFERVNNSHLQAMKRRLDLEEKKYNYNMKNYGHA